MSQIRPLEPRGRVGGDSHTGRIKADSSTSFGEVEPVVTRLGFSSQPLGKVRGLSPDAFQKGSIARPAGGEGGESISAGQLLGTKTKAWAPGDSWGTGGHSTELVSDPGPHRHTSALAVSEQG